jgi:pyruvate/2-oxoglutarate dehydrogenase complex dihydrolipoamide dehydrogenase (E3) component
MAWDYDLVVIGASSAGIQAALEAKALQARVALVDQTCQLSDSDALLSLNQAGIDAISGQGEFRNSKGLVWVGAERCLRSRRYLLALDGIVQPPGIPGLENIVRGSEFRVRSSEVESWSFSCGDATRTELGVFCLTREIQGTTLPERWIVLGGTPQALEQCQMLACQGCQVTLVVEGRSILPGEDLEILRYLQAYLEAEGVRILIQTPVLEIRALANQTLELQTPTSTLATEALMVATAYGADLEPLNLAEVQVAMQGNRVQVDRFLRTSNPHIYACGAALGGYALPHLAIYEARIALYNALFWPFSLRRRTIDYPQIPYTICTDPPLARVGLTELQARRYYGSNLCILRGDFRGSLQNSLRAGFCKFLLDRRNGKILGAHLLGDGAAEVIGTIALTLQQGIPIQDLTLCAGGVSSATGILSDMALQWRYQQLSQQLWLPGFFNWRRTGNF